MNTDLAQKQTAASLVATYQAAVAEIRRGFAIVHAAEVSLQQTFASGESSCLDVRDRYNQSRLSFDNADEPIERLRREVWYCIVARLEVRRLMSVKRAAELDRQLEKGEMPEITIENVAALIQGFAKNLDAMLEEAVQEVFDWLRPRRSHYKTNTEFEIGRRVILPYVVDEILPPVSGSDHYRVNHRYRSELTALENVFSALDGRGSINKSSWGSELAEAINQTTVGVGRGETRYFKFRCFQNRNMHLEFKRPDLVDKLNKIAGGMRLREKREETAA